MFERLLDKKDKLDALREGLEKIRFQIPIIPLSLVLLLEVVEEHQEVPASVTELYDRFIDVVLGREDKKKGIEVLFEYRVKKRFLADLAFNAFLCRGRLEVPQAEFDEFTANYVKEYGLEQGSLSTFLTEIERAGILSLGDTVKFSHRSFMDFFAAFHIFQTRDDIDDLNSFLRTIYFDDSWGDTAFFFVGLKSDITESLLRTILEYDDESLNAKVSKFGTGRLLQAGWHSASSVKLYGISTALRFAPEIRDDFLQLTASHRDKVPGIVADFFIMMLSDEAFRSGFLYKELRQFHESIQGEVSTDSLSMQMAILWVTRLLLPPNELRAEVDRCIDLLREIPHISVEEEARALVFLMILERNDKAVAKSIQGRLKSLAKKHPQAFKGLLPPKKPGFR
jgi:hypothetical protein